MDRTGVAFNSCVLIRDGRQQAMANGALGGQPYDDGAVSAEGEAGARCTPRCTLSQFVLSYEAEKPLKSWLLSRALRRGAT
jgi:hypothetical protein